MRPARLALRHLHVHDERGDRTGTTKPRPRVVEVVASDDRSRAALEDADDAAFGAVAVARVLDADDDAVAVHGLVEIAAGDVDAGAPSSAGASGSTNANPRGLRRDAADERFIRSGSPNRWPRISTSSPEATRARSRRLNDARSSRGILSSWRSSLTVAGWSTRSRTSRKNLFFGKHWD